jgi:hypothetical protein
MKQVFRSRRVAVAVAAALALATAARAQSGGPYTQTWSTLAGGGLTFSSGSGYRMGGTIAQPETERLAGAGYVLRGGFWNLSGGSVVNVDPDQTQAPLAFRVFPSVPNPFSDVTTVAFELPSEQRVDMNVFNVKGERVRRLLDQVMPAGRHQVTWAGIGDGGRRLPAGVYWVTTRAGAGSDTRKVVLLN